MKSLDVRGFTLVEALVVLVITSLVSALLFQALSQIYRLQGRFGTQLSASQIGVLQEEGWRQILQGLQTDFVDGKQRFSGSFDRLSGMSIATVAPTGAAPLAMTMQIDPGVGDAGGSLSYVYGDKRLTLMTWPAKGVAEFSYIDDQGQAHTQWPPRSAPLDAPQLPAAILLKRPTASGAEVLVAVPRSRGEAKVKAVDIWSAR